METCGNCKYANMMGDLTQRACMGGPPFPIIVMGPRGPEVKGAIRGAPVKPTDPACGLYKPKILIATTTDAK